MSYFEKLACLYGEEKFNDDELAEIGRFKYRLTKLASMDDEIGMARFFASEFGKMSSETFDKVDRYFEYLSLYGDDLYKVGQGHWVERLLPLLALGTAAAPLVEKGVSYLTRAMGQKSSLKTILQDHPELRKDSNIERYFQALVDFAPDVAGNPVVAGNILVDMHRMGPGALSLSTIKDLIKAQSDIGTSSVGLQAMTDPLFAYTKAFHEANQPPRQGGHRP
jgi:hypothetical protein